MSWCEFQERRATLEEVAFWFGPTATEKFNIGIVTGKISDLDADSDEAADFWQQNRPETPLIVYTGGGGFHFYYRHPGNAVNNRTRILGHKLDVRGDGGIVVAAPSVHESESLYRWQKKLEEISLDDVPLFKPSWIEDHQRKPEYNQRWTETSDDNIKRIRKYLSYITAQSGENGHAQTYRATCRLKDAGLSPEQALEELQLWSATNAFPPWSIKELIHKVESVYRCSLNLKND